MFYANGLSALLWAISMFLGSGLMVLADEAPCTLHHEGNYYNLNSLKASQDYEFKTLGGHSFYLNVCRRVTTEPWSTGVPSNVDIAGLVRKDHHDFAVGLVNTTLEMRDTELMLHLSNGSPCPGEDNLYGSSFIIFLCDPSVYGAGKPVVISQFPEDDNEACQYTVEWRTHFACPTGERGLISGLIVFLVITMMILLMLLIVFSTLYNRFVLKKRGFDQLTRLSKIHLLEVMDFCMELFQSALDNVRSSGNRWARLTRDINPASYQWSSRDEEQAMMAVDPLEDDHNRELQDTNVRRNDVSDGTQGVDVLGTVRS
ncbi:mannose-6-phosphate receptor binding domain-containing protein [Suillus discolor]|uniref:Mannose-6-phosphate receptor binding domain-containing protein n=1 Tax=Suillus discolor TaxID=1912936 RepID=A0A9P7F633_9AGAM|nr:mannose-6-phosphate receptor binding domain-containing protein [Suillus discolor]KAG2107006.1 mannose-6-phosphate receptor binding domain-containing protein [Suillus discolor]